MQMLQWLSLPISTYNYRITHLQKYASCRWNYSRLRAQLFAVKPEKPTSQKEAERFLLTV